MSILFGYRAFGEAPAQQRGLEGFSARTQTYASGVPTYVVVGPVAFGHQGTAIREGRPNDAGVTTEAGGNIVALDGRLDNAEDLCRWLGLDGRFTTDGRIILTAFRAIGPNSFSHFVGDWAVALWSDSDRCLYLARDHAGTRTLHYALDGDCLVWGTYLETFFACGQRRKLNLSHASAYLTGQLSHLMTPYEGVEVVPPAHYVQINAKRGITRHPHWDRVPDDILQLSSNQAYQEQFLFLFRQAVARRAEDARSGVVAELSGGMDSSSIVCVSDWIRRERGVDPSELLDTISYFDSDDPDWDELPFVEAVERDRGKAGEHLPLPLFHSDVTSPVAPSLLPGLNRALAENYVRQEELFGSRGYRAILSGLGGDELLGGVPTGVPELSDHLAGGRLATFVRRGFSWCLPDRRPLLHTASESIRFLVAQYRPPHTEIARSLPGATAKAMRLVRSNDERLSWTWERTWAAPSRIANARTWWKILEGLPHQRPHHRLRMEYRYPYLDRDLVEFLFRVPRERLLEPGRRRAMMRGALRGIVPESLLERKRKAYRSRAIQPVLIEAHDDLRKLFSKGFTVGLGLVERRALLEAVDSIQRRETKWIGPIARVLLFELWMRDQQSCVLSVTT